jgi:hypothetical protein
MAHGLGSPRPENLLHQFTASPESLFEWRLVHAPKVDQGEAMPRGQPRQELSQSLAAAVSRIQPRGERKQEQELSLRSHAETK